MNQREGTEFFTLIPLLNPTIMRVQKSILTEELKGKAGTVVAKGNNSWTSLLPVVTPRNPKTRYQVSTRQSVDLYSKVWANLTETERQEWNAKAGFSKNGISLFISQNTIRYNLGLEFLRIPLKQSIIYTSFYFDPRVDTLNNVISINFILPSGLQRPYLRVYVSKPHPTFNC